MSLRLAKESIVCLSLRLAKESVVSLSLRPAKESVVSLSGWPRSLLSVCLSGWPRSLLSVCLSGWPGSLLSVSQASQVFESAQSFVFMNLLAAPSPSHCPRASWANPFSLSSLRPPKTLRDKV